MVAAQWGESHGDTRSGGGIAGRFRPLGGSGEVPDTTPPPFGTAPWGYRRSEVDAWASWVAGIVAHARNETVRADSAEATLQATLDRLDDLERAPAPERDPAPEHDPAAEHAPEHAPEQAGAAEQHSTSERPGAPDDPRPVGRLHFDAPTDLPRRTARATASAPGVAGGPEQPEPPASNRRAPERDAPDHRTARLHVVESTLHEMLGLLHHLADPDPPTTGS